MVKSKRDLRCAQRSEVARRKHADLNSIMTAHHVRDMHKFHKLVGRNKNSNAEVAELLHTDDETFTGTKEVSRGWYEHFSVSQNCL